MDLKSLENAATALEPEERAKLVTRLLESLEFPGDDSVGQEWVDEWSVEVEKRVSDVISGKVRLERAKEVLARLRRQDQK